MASCPLGFGGPGAALSELSSYHCRLCRGLLHDPVVTNGCRHVFCSFCIRRFRDCPLCGADINSTSADASLAAKIQKLMLGHARLASKPATVVPAVCPVGASATNADKKGAAGCPVTSTTSTTSSSSDSVLQDQSMDLPSMLLQLALQSLAGGNPEAALARLDMCTDSLTRPTEPPRAAPEASAKESGSPDEAAGPPAEPGASPTGGTAGVKPDTLGWECDAAGGAAAGAENDPFLRRYLELARSSDVTASRLGSILGVKADCYRRLGDPDLAQRHYELSLACLEPWQGRSREVDRARSVTHNKLGDLLMVSERLSQAGKEYEMALRIRRHMVAVWTTDAALRAHKAAEAAEEAPRAASERAEAAGAVVAEPSTSAAPAPALAPADRADVEEMAQDLLDLTTSLCKVADLGLIHWEEGQQTRAAGESQRASTTTAAAGPGPATADQQAEPTAHQDARQQTERQRMQDPGSQTGQASEVAKLAALLAEARGVLLRPELLPYARACGITSAAEAGVTPAEGQAQKPQEHPQGGAGGSPGPKTAALRAAGSGSGTSSDAGRGPGARAKGAEGGSPGSEALAAPLVARYGKVWGVLDQMVCRMRELGIGGSD